jgi:SM-20-related protein
VKTEPTHGGDAYEKSPLFQIITQNILEQGYSIHPGALPDTLTHRLWDALQTLSTEQFNNAGIGRDKDYLRNDSIRSDEICWIHDQNSACRDWLDWAAALQGHLNRHLYLGLKTFESHFAHYAPSTFYKKHLDAFKGQTNRVLSLVVYLNPQWQANDGGELVLYVGPDKQDTLTVAPTWGTVVLFLSEEFPHEVLPTRHDRYSVTGWFRINESKPLVL